MIVIVVNIKIHALQQSKLFRYCFMSHNILLSKSTIHLHRNIIPSICSGCVSLVAHRQYGPVLLSDYIAASLCGYFGVKNEIIHVESKEKKMKCAIIVSELK